MELWFSVSPTIETLAAQALAAVFVVGSYIAARRHLLRAPKFGAA
jgi:high-affinity iron transporter